MSLYIKHRPSSLEEIKGNGETISALSSMLDNLETCPHSFLITGPTGCGKTTIGRIIANKLGCDPLDFKEIDSADFRGIDMVRDMRKNSQFMPVHGDCRVWLLDEVHKMTGDAQSALLKILEDTPSHVYFILCTTDPQKLLKTIKGRCSTFQMELLSDNHMKRLLRGIVREEKGELETEVYDQIIQDSQGHARNALQILEQVLAVSPEEQLKIASKAAEEQSQIIELCRALMGGKPWGNVKTILAGLKGQEPESIRRMVLGYAQNTLLRTDDEKAGLILEEFLEPTYDSGFPQIVYACYSVIKN